MPFGSVHPHPDHHWAPWFEPNRQQDQPRTAFASASALSVRSQVASGSSRPK